MSRHTVNLTPALYQYILDVSLREAPLLRQLREETAQHAEAKMQIAPDQGQFMALLVRLMGARRVLEVGVFTGYSSLAVALALPHDGHLTACDISEEYMTVARRYWDAAGVGHKIEPVIGPAVETLNRLQPAAYDMAFIDADKQSYDTYYEHALRLLRPGGLVLIDNVLRNGAVAAPTKSEATAAIQRLNRKLHRDDRIHLSLVPIGDGLTLGLKV